MGVGVSFLVLVCPTGLGGFVFKYGLPKGAGSFGLVCPTGPGVGGSFFFFKYWSAQRDRGWEGLFFLSTGLPNGTGGGGGSFFLSTGLPNGFGGVFVFFQVLVCPTGLEGFSDFVSVVRPTGLEGFSDFVSVVRPTGLEGFSDFFFQ